VVCDLRQRALRALRGVFCAPRDLPVPSKFPPPVDLRGPGKFQSLRDLNLHSICHVSPPIYDFYCGTRRRKAHAEGTRMCGAASGNRTRVSSLGSSGIATIRWPRRRALQTKATRPTPILGELALGVHLEHFETWALADPGGPSEMAEQKLPKLNTWVRFPSPAPAIQRVLEAG
jgi:hypothetical protein